MNKRKFSGSSAHSDARRYVYRALFESLQGDIGSGAGWLSDDIEDERDRALVATHALAVLKVLARKGGKR